MPLRVALWGPRLARVSGGNLYDRMLVEYLRARGHQVAVRAFAGDREDEPDPPDPPEVVLQDELLHREFLARNLALKRPRPRIIAIVHHLMCDEPERNAEERGRLRREERAYLRTVEAVVAPSRASAESALRLAGTSLSVTVAPPGRDRLAGEALPVPPPSPGEIRARAGGPLRAAFVGSLIPRKRLLELLQALAAVPGWTLSIAGREDLDPGYADRARERAASPDLAGRVRLCGPLGPDGLAALLRESCLLAVPSTLEGFGIVYLEGFAFGLPALAAASGGAPEIVSEGETGWLIPPGPSETTALLLAEHLESLSANRARLAAMGVRAAAVHRAHPTWAESFNAVEGLLTGAGG